MLLRDLFTTRLHWEPVMGETCELCKPPRNRRHWWCRALLRAYGGVAVLPIRLTGG